jgi:hypothetical protein
VITETVIASSDHKLPEAWFDGNAMVGADVLLGPGATSTYGEVPAGQDGAYVTVMRTAQSAVIGTDAAGRVKLFVYRDGERWAVGTSLIELAEWVRRSGWSLSTDDTALRSFLLEGAVGNQLTSDRTVFREIRLVPAGWTATITGGRRRAFALQAPRPLPAWASFGGLLRQGLHDAVSRAQTLLDAGLPLAVNVTGDRDFRVALAVLLAGNLTGRPLGEVVEFRVDERRPGASQAAEELGSTFGFAVGRRNGAARATAGATEAFAQWRRHDLGIYGPIYPPKVRTAEILVAGAGGEAHRRVYKSASMSDVIEQAAGERLDAPLVADLDESVRGALASVGPAGADPRVVHFREFRDRIHFGRTAFLQPTFAPLTSDVLRRASLLRDPSGALGTQVMTDVIRNLEPALLEPPLQSTAKPIPRSQVSAATTVSPKSPSSGTVHGALDEPSRSGEPWSLAPYVDAFERTVGAVQRSELLPEQTIRAAQTTIAQVELHGAFPHAVDGQAVSTVVLTGEVLRLVAARSRSAQE